MGFKSIKEHTKSPFVKGVLTLFTGATFAQFFPILFTPVLTRLYSSEEFGVFFLFTSIFTILSVVATLRYELALVLPEKDSDAGALFKLGSWLSVSVSILYLVLLYAGYDIVRNSFAGKNIGSWLFLIPLATCLFGLSQMLNFWNNRFSNYKNITYAKVSRSIVVVSVQILVWFVGYTAYGLIWGYISGIAATIFMYIFTLEKNKKKELLESSTKGMLALVKKYKNIPIYNTLLVLSSNLSSHLPLIILTKFYGIEIAAFYGLTTRVLSTPLSLIGQSVSQVFFKEVATRVNNNIKIKPLLLKIYQRIFLAATIPIGIIIFFGPWLFGAVFGTEWAESGIYAQILAPVMLLNMVNVPVSSIITNLNKQKQVLYISIFWLVIKIGGIWAGFYFYDSVIKSLWFFSIASAIYIAILLLYYTRISGNLKDIYQ